MTRSGAGAEPARAPAPRPHAIATPRAGTRPLLAAHAHLHRYDDAEHLLQLERAELTTLVAAVQAQRAGHGSLWLVPESLHEPIRQDVVMLARARDNAIAAAFVAFLRTDARAVIASLGYGVAPR